MIEKNTLEDHTVEKNTLEDHTIKKHLKPNRGMIAVPRELFLEWLRSQGFTPDVEAPSIYVQDSDIIVSWKRPTPEERLKIRLAKVHLQNEKRIREVTKSKSKPEPEPSLEEAEQLPSFGEHDHSSKSFEDVLKEKGIVP